MAQRKTLSDAEIRAKRDKYLSIVSVYGRDNNDAPYIPEDISSNSDSDGCVGP